MHIFLRQDVRTRDSSCVVTWSLYYSTTCLSHQMCRWVIVGKVSGHLAPYWSCGDLPNSSCHVVLRWMWWRRDRNPCNLSWQQWSPWRECGDSRRYVALANASTTPTWTFEGAPTWLSPSWSSLNVYCLYMSPNCNDSVFSCSRWLGQYLTTYGLVCRAHVGEMCALRRREHLHALSWSHSWV
jgi:hypothetical protein